MRSETSPIRRVLREEARTWSFISIIFLIFLIMSPMCHKPSWQNVMDLFNREGLSE